MPDYYNLMLEISSGRTTKASKTFCSLEMFEAGACPRAVQFGETFVKRSVNEQCEKTVSVDFIMIIIMYFY